MEEELRISGWGGSASDGVQMLKDLKLAFFLALRSIRRGSKGTLIVTIIIMTLSIVNLFFMPALIDTINDRINEQIVDTLYGHVVIEPKEGDDYLANPVSILKKIHSLPEVVSATAEYDIGATFEFGDRSGGIGLTVIDPQEEMTFTNVHDSLLEGDYL
ncbi:hypothetical protein JXC34_02850, partial [Candidatus Woesearchaeota archaeon]|nr:hypothetical protein [Candidatus Woesearchaeota archaeon]